MFLSALLLSSYRLRPFVEYMTFGICTLPYYLDLMHKHKLWYIWCIFLQSSLTQQQLWRSVPEGDNTIGVSISLAVFSQAEGSGQTKVSQFKNTISGNKHVGGFHVSVKNLIQKKAKMWLQHWRQKIIHHAVKYDTSKNVDCTTQNPESCLLLNGISYSSTYWSFRKKAYL